MKILLQIALVAGCLSFAACSQSEQPTAAGTSGAPAPPAVTTASRQSLEERLAAIEASGRIGLWASVSDVCRQEIGKGLRTTLSWNVKGHADHVVLFVIDPKHGEQHFGQGGAVGERETGPWLQPGLVFLIRAADTGEELGRVRIVEKPAEACPR